MDENNKSVTAADEERDEALFHAIGKDKKKKKIRRVITAVVIVAVLAGGITTAVLYGRKKVRQQVSNETTSSVVPYTVDTGSVITTVQGTGQLADVDTEKLTVPAGVTVDKLLVTAGQRVEAGTPLASVDVSTVMGALSDVQAKITELDGKLRAAAGDAVGANITAGVNGRVKKVYAQADSDVAACMIDNGALALLSLDGYMAVDVETDALTQGQTVTVVRADGQELQGTVDNVLAGSATVLVTDNGPQLDEKVTVFAPEGEEIGSGALYIHDPLRITGYAGTVSAVRTQENAQVWAGNILFNLKDTAYSANYEAILKERRGLEEDLVELLDIQSTGTVKAPYAGTVSSVDYKDPNAPTDDSGAEGGAFNGISNGSAAGQTNGQTGTEGETAAAETPLVTLAQDEQMSITFPVDELDILSLEVGQDAQVTINSIEGEIFSGTVTEINRSGNGGESGVTNYTAVVTMPKDQRMLSGMSAKVVVRIQSAAGTVRIPEEALHQSRDEAFVYTSYDPATGELTEPRPVIAGLSDGSMVEIVEGLSQGDTVYYIQVWSPYYHYGSDGDASGGNAWVEDTDASGGDADASGGDASDGDAGE